MTATSTTRTATPVPADSGRAVRASRLPSIALVYASGLLAGLTVVAFPASGTVLKTRFGLDDAGYGALFLPQTVLTILASLGGPALGRKIGLRTTLALSLACNALAALCLAAVAWVPARGVLLVLLAGTAALGTGFGLAAAPLNGYPALLFPRRAQPALVALHTLLGAGFALGPALVAGLAGRGAWQAFPLAVAGAAVLLAVACTRVALPRSASGAAAAQAGTKRDKTGLWAFALAAVFYALAEGTFSNWAAIYLHDARAVDEDTAGLAISAFWAALSIGRLVVSALIARVAAEHVWLVLPCLMAAVFLALPTASGASDGIALFALAGLATSAFFPLTVAIAVAREPARSAFISSALTAALMAGVGGGSFLLGALRAALPFETLYRVSALYPAAALAFAFIALSGGRPRAGRARRENP